MTPDTAEFGGLHILLVDDDPLFLDVVEAMLKKLGVDRVTRAVNGSDAFGKISKIDRVVDCILCDYTMAPGNGLQLLQAVRLGQIKLLRPDMCFVLFTGSANSEIVKTAAELDVNGYLVKPATPEKLAATISKARKRGFAIDMDKYVRVQVPL